MFYSISSSPKQGSASFKILNARSGPRFWREDKNLKFHFGTVLVSMHTLFRAISGGLEWRHAVMALENSLGWGSLEGSCRGLPIYFFTCPGVGKPLMVF